MQVEIALELMKEYAACPRCGRDEIGAGAGSLEIHGNVFCRSCVCGWSVTQTVTPPASDPEADTAADAADIAFRPGQWVLEFKPDGGGRYGPLRDPVFSPKGRLRMTAAGLQALSGQWFHYAQPLTCTVPAQGARRLTLKEIAHVTGGMIDVHDH